MRHRMRKKYAKAVAMIQGADGPTAVFLGNGNKKQSLKQRLYKMKYNYRKKKAIRNLKAQPHNMDEVIEYAKEKFGYVEISKESERYQEEYRQMRASFVMMYEPALLGDLCERPKLAEQTEEALERFQSEIEQRQKRAEQVPADVFDIELSILETEKDNLHASILIEKKYQYIGGSASGNDKQMKEFEKNYKEINLYFGVEQSDIDNQTKRYTDLIRTLARG